MAALEDIAPSSFPENRRVGTCSGVTGGSPPMVSCRTLRRSDQWVHCAYAFVIHLHLYPDIT